MRRVMIMQVWRKWSTGSAADVVDPSLAGQYPEVEIFNCVEVGLLCVQENPADRPDASAVVLLLGSPNSIPVQGRQEPSKPAFFFDGSLQIGEGQLPSVPSSENMMTISDFEPR
jgi:hypothetical protein